MLKNTGSTLMMSISFLAAQGCVVHAYDTYEEPTQVVVVSTPFNAAPYVVAAESGVFYDAAYRDDIWYFDAFVDDPDGVYDVIGVWADVYDECRGGELVQSFELYPTSDPSYWTSEWFGSSTWLDPFAPCYSVDFVACDTYDAYGFVTVWALTY